MKNTHHIGQPKSLIIALLWLTSFSTFAQVNYTANDRVIPYDGSFRYGVNMGYYPNWTSEQLGHIAAGNASLGLKGVGITSARPSLNEEVLETFGYNALVPTFESFYQSGIRDMTVIVGDGPSGPHRDYTQYCPGKFSDVFANLYEPIWDGGANGTPVNEKNYYALYLWKTANAYKKYVKIWEIVNEPDYDESGTQWPSDFNLNFGWWNSNPDPCTYQLHAPIYNYIRMLRISWEVLKSVNPDAQVSIGALGYASFLDVVMRNTDNPNGGAVSADFPLKGGAYFDIMGYHIYPHIDGSLWTYNFQSDRILGYHRNSDGAIDSGLVKKQAFFQSVLTKYGYDGSRFPKKPWVVTEFNLPRRSFEPRYPGSNELQVNSIIKASVECYQQQITQLHVYQLGDNSTPQEAFFEFQEMGLYNKLSATAPYNVRVNPVGVAYKTTSDLLSGSKFDAERTALLNIPRNLDGGAFKQTDGSYVYVLWAKTQTDNSEVANGTYSFPASLNLSGLKKYAWDFSETNNKVDISSQNIALTGTPIFITTGTQTDVNCKSKGTAPWELWVANVRFNTLNNASDKFKDFSTLGFSDYTNLNTTVTRGQTYPLSITAGLSWVGNLPNAYCRVWIDFNGNNIFEDSEKVLEQTNQSPFSANVLVPTTATTGNVRMRVSMKWGSNPTACETFDRGEVEDYTVTIQGGTDLCAGDVTPPVFQDCPKNIVLTTSGTTAVGTWTTPTATDNCTASPSVSSTHVSGFAFPIGVTNVVYTATDSKNNTATCSFTVTVQTQTTGTTDIALSLSATPSLFKPYTPLSFSISAKNNGNQVFTNVNIEFKFPANTVNGGNVTPSVGTWQQWCSNGLECFTWAIPTLAANATVTLNVPLYVLIPTPPLVATTRLLSSTPADNFLANNSASISLNQAPPPPVFSVKIQPTQTVPVVIQKISPNPSENEMVLELTSLNEREVMFEFSDAFGKIVKTEARKVEQGMNQLRFDISTLPQGVYLVSPSVGNRPTKFVKM